MYILKKHSWIYNHHKNIKNPFFIKLVDCEIRYTKRPWIKNKKWWNLIRRIIYQCSINV